MRSLKILMLSVAVILSGFAKDSQRIKAGGTVPLKFDGTIITDPKSETVCTPVGDPYPYISHSRTGWLQGNQSQGGRLITEQSTWTILNCDTNFDTMVNTSLIEGVNTMANGDSFSYTCSMETNIVTMEIVLYVTIKSGTGRYEGATGQITLKGTSTGLSTIPVSGWGTVAFSK
jgi:hypothetical protein